MASALAGTVVAVPMCCVRLLAHAPRLLASDCSVRPESWIGARGQEPRQAIHTSRGVEEVARVCLPRPSVSSVASRFDVPAKIGVVSARQCTPGECRGGRCRAWSFAARHLFASFTARRASRGHKCWPTWHDPEQTLWLAPSVALRQRLLVSGSASACLPGWRLLANSLWASAWARYSQLPGNSRHCSSAIAWKSTKAFVAVAARHASPR